jgi:hypothetical protein
MRCRQPWSEGPAAAVAVGVLVWAVLMLAAPVIGAAGSAAVAQAQVEPRAVEILQRMSRSLGSAQALRFRAYDMADQVMANGQKLQFGRTVTVAARRPGAVSATVKGDAEDVHFGFSGSKLTIVNHRERCYAVQDVPPTIDQMFDFLAERFGITAPLADLLFSEPYSAMMGRVRSGQYVGLHWVGQTQCHHLAFRQEGIDWQIWIEDSEQAVPRKIVITYKELPGQPQFVALLDEWNLSADLPQTTFDIDVPADYKRIDLQLLASPATTPARP